MKFSALELDSSCAASSEDNCSPSLFISVHDHSSCLYSESHYYDIPSEPKWQDWLDYVEQKIGEKPQKMCYMDEENDMVSVDSDAEWQEAINVAVRNGGRLKMFVQSFAPSTRPPLCKLHEDDSSGIGSTIEPVAAQTSSPDTTFSCDLNSASEPPVWFTDYMEKFRADLTTDIVKKVIRRIQKLSLAENTLNRPAVSSKDEQANELSSVACAEDFPQLKTSKTKKNLVSEQPTDQLQSAPLGRTLPTNGELPVHRGIFCDMCRSQIVGVRYMCGNCPDFDLCATCEASNHGHFPEHVFIKFHKPAPGIRRNQKTGKLAPLLSSILYPRHDAQAFPRSSRNKALPLKHRHKQEKSLQKSLCIAAAVELGAGQLVSARGNLMSTLWSHTSEPLKPIKSTMDAAFIRDETVSDGTKFPPGIRFTKSWCVVNVGSRPWNEDTLLKFFWGTKDFLPNSFVVVAPPLKPQEQGKISVEYTSPLKPGFYESHWNFVHKGHLFGHRIWCSIEVVAPEADAVASETSADQPNIIVQEPENGEKKMVPVMCHSEDVSGKDILEFDDGEVEECKPKFLSQTATPNNTPFILSPTKSPEPSELEKELELQSLSDCEDLLLDDDVQALIESEVTSIISWNSSDSDAEYVVVPVPSCFNFSPVEDEGSASEAVVPSECRKESSSSSSVMFIGSDGEDVISAPHPGSGLHARGDHSYARRASVSGSGGAVGLSDETSLAPVGNAVTGLLRLSSETGELSDVVFSRADKENNNNNNSLSSSENCTDATDLERTQSESSSSTVENEVELSQDSGSVVVTQPPAASGSSLPASESQNGDGYNDALRVVNVLPEGLVSAAATILNSACTALSAIQWVPSAPPELPASVVNPQTLGILPQEDGHSGGDSAPPDSPASRVSELLWEMGFYNTQLNTELSQKHNGNLEKILDELVRSSDSDWYVHRH